MRKSAIWLGPIIAIGACISYLMFFSQYPITRDNPFLSLGLGALGLFLSFIGLFAWRKTRAFGRFSSLLGLMLSFVFTGSLFIYVFLLSSDIPAAPTVASFTNVKTMKMKAAGGQTISLANYPGKQVIVSFFRGYW